MATDDTQSQDQLLTQVQQDHETDPHPGLQGPALRIHLAVHVVVETQLASGDPPVVAATLDRLMALGMSRHEAVHAIGQVASEEVIDCLARGERYDEARYRARLDRLQPPPEAE